MTGTKGISSVAVYPNPATDVLTVVTSADVQAGSYVILSDPAGRVISTLAVQDQETKVVLGDLPTGLYIVKYVSASYVKTFQVSKKD